MSSGPVKAKSGLVMYESVPFMRVTQSFSFCEHMLIARQEQNMWGVGNKSILDRIFVQSFMVGNTLAVDDIHGDIPLKIHFKHVHQRIGYQ